MEVEYEIKGILDSYLNRDGYVFFVPSLRNEANFGS